MTSFLAFQPHPPHPPSPISSPLTRQTRPLQMPPTASIPADCPRLVCQCHKSVGPRNLPISLHSPYVAPPSQACMIPLLPKTSHSPFYFPHLIFSLFYRCVGFDLWARCPRAHCLMSPSHPDTSYLVSANIGPSKCRGCSK